MDLFKQASEIKPAVAHYSLGNALVQSRTSEAIAEYKEAVRINPDYAEAHNNLGSALLLTGRTAEAIDEYNHALQIDPGYAQAHNNLGNALVQTGRAPEAIDHYKEALRITPTSADAHNNLAAALAQMGRTFRGDRTTQSRSADQSQRYRCPKQSDKVGSPAENRAGKEVKSNGFVA